MSVTVGLIVLALLTLLWGVLRVTSRQKPTATVVGILALVVAVYTAGVYTVHRYMPSPETPEVPDTSSISGDTATPESAVPVFVQRVQQGPFSARVTCAAIVVAFSDENVYAPVSGRIVSMPVQTGDEVKPGQLLVKLANRESAPRPPQKRAGLTPASSPTLAQTPGRAAGERDRGADQAPATPGDDGRTAREELAADPRLKEAQAAAETARSGLARAQAELASAEADLTHWDAELVRLKALPGADPASSEEYRRAATQREAAAARRQQAQATVSERQAVLASAEERVKAIQAALPRATVTAGKTTHERGASGPEVPRINGSRHSAALTVTGTVGGYTEIRAAGRARVMERAVSPGATVSPGTPLLELSQLHRVRLQASLSQTDMTGIQIGNLVHVHILSTPAQTLQTRVTAIRPGGNLPGASSIVEAVVDNAGYRLSAGQVVTMEIVTAAVPQALTVPLIALVPRTGPLVGQSGAAQYAVWTVRAEQGTAKPLYTCPLHPEVLEEAPGACPVCRGGLVPVVSAGGRRTAHLVDVTTGPNDGERAQILAGLKAGQEVIVAGYASLKEGQPVEPAPWVEP